MESEIEADQSWDGETWWNTVYDMARNHMTTEMAEDRIHWHVMIRAGTLRSVEADRWEGEKKTLYVYKQTIYNEQNRYSHSRQYVVMYTVATIIYNNKPSPFAC